MNELFILIGDINALIWNLIGILFGIVILKIAFEAFCAAFKER